jgi:hypothetical protein
MSSIILALVVLAVAAGAYRAWRRRPTGGAAADIPTVVVGWAAGLLSVGRAEWGQAMVGELGQYEGAARWRFALGCAVAAFGLPRRGGSRRWVVASVLVASIASAGLVGYGFVRYPGMVTGAGTWLAVAAFATVLVGFVVVTGVTTRQSPIGVTGLVCGCALAGVWIVVGLVAVSARSKTSMLLLLILPVVSIAVGVFGARRGRTRTAGRRTVLVTAVVAALAVFLVLAADTLITGGRPYDAGQLQDFASSGYPDMATYAVSDDLGTAMVLLLLMSAMTAILGSAGATLAIRRGR